MLKRLYFWQPLFAGILFLLFPAMLSAQSVEDCNNGVDDDGDGLIDCYDPDCTCTGQCDSFYYTTCNANCFYIPPCNQITLGIQWVGEAPTGTYSTLVAGDMDGDGFPEIVTYQTEAADIYIIDGVTGATKVHIIGPTILPGGTAPAIADLDHDGFGEIVIVGQDRLLRCYEHDGTLKYASVNQVGYGSRYRFSVPNIADFDHNGWAEVNIGNQVYNGQTGVLLAEAGSGASAGEHPARVALNFSFASPVAMDVLPDNFCADCAGLEIVAGNQVMSVNLITGQVTPVLSAPAPFTDGFTSVVDFDRDGDLDAIVQGKKGTDNTIYVWDIQTNTILREFQLFSNWVQGASRPNVADLNGDGQLEVSFVEYPTFYALANDFSVLWTRPTTDVSSITCSSVFDFCGDGSSDVIYRGQDRLQIIEGATGQVKWEDDCLSLTHIENPLVLDVDADGQTEIVIECGQNGSTVDGRVVVYEAIGTPGIASRRVWNQHAYFNTNINDDLSVPQYQQNPHIVGDSLKLNAFLNQFFNPSFPSPDGVLTFDAVQCVGDSMDVTVQICNIGSNVLPPQTPVSLYQGNPTVTAATWVGAAPIGFALFPDSCQSFTFRLPRLANDSLFLVLNDDHSLPAPFNLAQNFPVTAIGECVFVNNLASFYLTYDPAPVGLGPDTTLCGDQQYPMDVAGNDLLSFLWQDGSTLPVYTATGPGVYAVQATDVCGIVHADTLSIFLDTSTVVQLGPDRELCAGETFSLGESGFDYYVWSPAGIVSCTDCPGVTVAPDLSGFVRLEAGFNNGCKSVDTLFLTVYDTFNYTIDTTICYGREVDWFGTVIPPDSSVTFALQTTHGCDSIVQVRVTGTTIGTYQITVDTSVCLGSTLPYNGFDLMPGEEKIFHLTAETGCDSTVLVRVMPKDTFSTAETLVICAGESANIFGQPVDVSGVYRRTFTAQNGCDSTHQVDLTVLSPLLISFDATPSCYQEMTGTLQATVDGSAPPFSYAWNLPNASGAMLDELPAGTYSLTVTDANDCTQTAITEVTAYPPINFLAQADSVSCYGDSDGAIRLEYADPTLSFSIDNGPFYQTTEFLSLTSGDYQLLVQDAYGCQDTLEVTVPGPPPLELALPADVTLKLGDSIRVDILHSSLTPLQYQWNDTTYLPCTSCTGFFFQPLSSLDYQLTVTDANGCTASDNWRVQVDRILDIFTPNAIRLNAANDYNSRFRPGFGVAIRQVNLLQIYDRWGSLLYSVDRVAPDDSMLYWDGHTRGDAVQPGVYLWIMELELVDGSIERIQGDLTVLN